MEPKEYQQFREELVNHRAKADFYKKVAKKSYEQRLAEHHATNKGMTSTPKPVIEEKRLESIFWKKLAPLGWTFSELYGKKALVLPCQMCDVALYTTSSEITEELIQACCNTSLIERVIQLHNCEALSEA